MALLTVRNHFYHFNFKRFCWREGVFLRDPNHLDTLAAEITMGEKGSALDKDRDGRVELRGGRYLAPDVAAVLFKAAKNGGMTRVQMDDDKRRRWVCKEVADRDDRSVPKE